MLVVFLQDLSHACMYELKILVSLTVQCVRSSTRMASSMLWRSAAEGRLPSNDGEPAEPGCVALVVERNSSDSIAHDMNPRPNSSTDEAFRYAGLRLSS